MGVGTIPITVMSWRANTLSKVLACEGNGGLVFGLMRRRIAKDCCWRLAGFFQRRLAAALVVPMMETPRVAGTCEIHRGTRLRRMHTTQVCPISISVALGLPPAHRGGPSNMPQI
jgi:hypothetical protein